MKKDIHPEYREVLFHDTGVDEYFIINSTLETTETKKWEDGKTHVAPPSVEIRTFAASHPSVQVPPTAAPLGSSIPHCIIAERFPPAGTVIEGDCNT